MPEHSLRELSTKLVGTLISRPAIFVLPGATLRTVAEVLTEEQVGVALVRGPNYRPIGIVSERDLVMALADDADPDTETAQNIMTAELETMSVDEPIQSMIQAMVADEIRHVPLLRGNEIAGVVSSRDLLRLLANELNLL